MVERTDGHSRRTLRLRLARLVSGSLADTNEPVGFISMLDDELKQHRKQLEVAINGALTESPRVSEIIHEIRKHGYDVFLIIEATVGFSRKKGEETEEQRIPAARLELTTQDERFLRSLKIRPE